VLNTRSKAKTECLLLETIEACGQASITDLLSAKICSESYLRVTLSELVKSELVEKKWNPNECKFYYSLAPLS
jgi:DNA-binding HxlR family transcriptional regulator